MPRVHGINQLQAAEIHFEHTINARRIGIVIEKPILAFVRFWLANIIPKLNGLLDLVQSQSLSQC